MSLAVASTTTIDRREQHYGRVGRSIAADALSFYVRAETGRAWQQLFIRGAMLRDDQAHALLASAPTYDPGEPEPDQFAIPYADLSHGA